MNNTTPAYTVSQWDTNHVHGLVCAELLQSLRDIGQSHCERLHSGERILEIQSISVAVDSSELHHLFEKRRLMPSESSPR